MIRDPSDGSIKRPTWHKPEMPRLSFDEIKAKHGGENWGIKAAEPEKPEGKKLKVPAPTPDQLRHHYAHYGLGFQPKKDEDAA